MQQPEPSRRGVWHLTAWVDDGPPARLFCRVVATHDVEDPTGETRTMLSADAAIDDLTGWLAEISTSRYA